MKESNKEDFSTIITPPDIVSSTKHTVIMIDPEWTEVEDVALYLKTAKNTYAVYVYRMEMNDNDWLKQAMSKSSHVIVNTINNESSPVKDKIVTSKKTGSRTHYYGPKNFLMSQNRIEKPIDYFINLEK